MWFAVLLLIVSGFLLSLSFAPYNARFFAYVSFIPLFFIITRSSSYKKVFLLGLLFGFIFFFFHLWWLYFLMVPVTKATKILLYLGITILLGYLALYVAIFSLLTKFFGLLWAPLIWALLEFLRTKSEIGFPWALLGASQTPYTPLIQIASIFGVYGLSSWVILVNLLFYYLLIKKRRLLYLISILLVFFVPLGYGILRVKKNTFAFKVALVQPNVHPNEKGDRASRERLTEELIYLIKKAIKEQPKLIILPETATLVDITKDQELARRFQSLADENGVYIFSGTPIYERYSNVYYNGAVLLEPKFYPRSDSNYELISVEFSKIYRKIRLVPFSERIPFIDKIPFMRYLETVDMGSCSPGHEYTIFELEDTLPVNKFAALICFESIFPDLARNFVIRGAQFLVNITNDGWFGNTPGPYEHCELAILRAVENGVPLLRCANNGITLIADPYGRILKKTTLFSMKVLTGEVPQPLKTTIYRQYGDFFIVGAACLAMIGLIVNIIIKIKKKPKRF
ncbi:MAG: apolipoprotein N-acyltransferase [candidate division WOR-3 bacterium]|nr:apolipoprotein N-acyltransferase [candidate division WOR-3 bacterium]MCX7756859.1 apolipoprotein N-acyltransferase [candidate division WOR-3 bacterium]MDW7987631.1 apolipoprotein N-acyltransferase [candidate division WOR-3 bacterium]